MSSLTQDEQHVIGTRDVAEPVVVVGPHNADLQKANGVGQVRGPKPEECVEEARALLGVRHLDLQDQERDRDSKNPIAERLDPGGIVVAVPGSTDSQAHTEISLRPDSAP